MSYTISVKEAEPEEERGRAMVTEHFFIDEIPAVLYGERADRVWLYVHGKCGNKEEGKNLADIACPRGFQILAVDLPEHGERCGTAAKFVPWEVIPELHGVLAYAKRRWKSVSLHAVSIGAYFSLIAFPRERFDKCQLVSPVLDMAALIGWMMERASVTAERLRAEKEIDAGNGETLSWEYYTFAKEHPIREWNSPTAVLYAGRDIMTDRQTVTAFAERFGCALRIYEDGEHWFHTDKQLEVWRDFVAGEPE